MNRIIYQRKAKKYDKINFMDFIFASHMCKQMTKVDDHIEFDISVEISW